MRVKSILMVCRGNICRSPMAEFFFSHQVNHGHHHLPVTITSAGLTALVDHPADPNAQTVMKKNGIDISPHRARQLTEKLVRESDLILVMSQIQRKILAQQFLLAQGKTFLLGNWQNFEVQDPFKKPYQAFEEVYRQIELAWQDWKTRI